MKNPVDTDESVRAADVPGDRATRAAIGRLQLRQDLDRDEMTEVVREIMRGDCHDAQLGALLLGLAAKGETTDEIVGAATAMREAVRRVPTVRSPVLDTCGTGGSGVPRRNVSTAVALAVAACGVAVAKHGNRAASSRSGSADVLDVLGVNLHAEPETVGRSIDALGIGFLFAPSLHPAMKHVANARRMLGVRTIFNLLGPLTNPAGATRQLLGVYDPARCTTLASALGALGSERVIVVHGFFAGTVAGAEAPAGIDDISPEGETLAVEWYRGRQTAHVLRPQMAGLPSVGVDGLAGGTPAENAEALLRVLDGEPGPYRTAVIYSGAAALWAARDGSVDDLAAYAEEIAAAIDDGRARSLLAEMIAHSHHDARG
jgi:anthranilate phosphoribosyltransferase